MNASKRNFSTKELSAHNLQIKEKSKKSESLEESRIRNMKYSEQEDANFDGDISISGPDLKEKIKRLDLVYSFKNSEQVDKISSKGSARSDLSEKEFLDKFGDQRSKLHIPLEEISDMRIKKLEAENKNTLNASGERRNTSPLRSKDTKFKNSLQPKLGTRQGIESDRKTKNSSDKDQRQILQSQSSKHSLDAETKLLYRLISNLYLVKKFISRLQGQANLRTTKFLREKHFNLINDLSVNVESSEKEKVPEFGLNRVVRKLERSISYLMKFQAMSCLKLSFERLAELKGKYLLTFDPTRTFHKIWDILMIFFIMVYFIIIPINLGFDMNFWENWEKSSPLLTSFFRSLSIYFFFADIGVNFNTSIYLRGKLETSRKVIAKNYIGKQFIRDLLSASFLVIEYYGLDQGEKRILRWMGVLFITRIFTISEILSRMERSLFYDNRIHNKMLLINLIVRMLVLSHIFACSWHYVAYINSDGDSWLELARIQNEDWLTKYIYSFYYVCVTMNTVGFGDIHPTNKLEVVYTIFFVYVACGIFAFNLNSVGIIVQDINRRNNMFKHNLTLINGYMSKKQINSDLRVKIRKYLEYIWLEENTQTVEEENKIISKLSENLKEELLLEANSKILKNIPYFSRNFSEELLRKTVNVIQEIRFTPEDIIFMKDDYDDNSLYVVRKGEVEIFVITPRANQPMTSLKRLKSGDVFGEFCFFTGLGRKACARSTEFTSLYRIRQEDFLNLMKSHPEDFEKFCMIRDKMILNKSLEALEIKCYSCNMIGHFSVECPLLHYTPSREVMIHRFTYSKSLLQRGAANRRCNKSQKFNALLNKLLVTDEIEIFRADNNIEASLSEGEESKYSERKNSHQETKEVDDSPQSVRMMAKIKEREEDSSENLFTLTKIKGPGIEKQENGSPKQTMKDPLKNSSDRKQRKSVTELQYTGNFGEQGSDEETKKSEEPERSELSKLSAVSPELKKSFPSIFPFPKNNLVRQGFRNHFDSKDISDDEDKSRVKERLQTQISNSSKSLNLMGSMSSLNSSYSLAVKKKLAFMHGQMFEETYDKARDVLTRIPLSIDGDRRKTIRLLSPRNNIRSKTYRKNTLNKMVPIIPNKTAEESLDMYRSKRSSLNHPRESINYGQLTANLKEEEEEELAKMEFLKQFDVMKRFKVYFPHNNIENVIRMYEHPSMDKRKRDLRFRSKNSIFKGASGKNLINIIQKKRFFKQESESQKEPYSPLKRNKKEGSQIKSPGKIPPLLKARKKFSDFLFFAKPFK